MEQPTRVAKLQQKKERKAYRYLKKVRTFGQGIKT
jgi:hypothetical protein